MSIDSSDLERRLLLGGLAGAAGLTALAAMSKAGPLTPPAGAVAGTGKTNQEVYDKIASSAAEGRIQVNATNTPGDATSVYRITQPGSYYLAGNVAGASGKHGIAIASSGVSLDLNGYELLGVAGSLDGISVTVGGTWGIEVRNGHVRAWGGDGVDIGTVSTQACRLENLRSSLNSGAGFKLGSGSVTVGCTAAANGTSGFVLHNTCSLHACSSFNNNTTGFDGGFGCTLSACAAGSNNGGGFVNCQYVTIVGAAAYGNGGNGFSVTSSLLESCVARGNLVEGINVTSNCLVRGCLSVANGTGVAAAGIRVAGSSNHIEGNSCHSQATGIRADFAGNFIVKNTCRGNTTNYSVVASNVFLAVAASTTAAAVNGSAGGTSPGSTDPNANFSF